MAATATPPGSQKRAAFARPKEPEALDVSAYDRVSSMLVTVLIMLGVVVLLMFLVWLSMTFKYNPPIVPVTVVEELGGGGSGNGAPGAEQQLEEVSPDEVQDLQEVSVDQAIQAVGDAVASRAVDLDAMEGGSGFGNGEGTGTGDGRGPGPGGPGTATQLPDWEVRFNATTLELYAQQLDFFGIELGAIGGGKKTVDYASKLSQAKPVVRTAPGDQERRRYLVWRKGPLAQADRDLLAKAGIDPSGRIVLQFIPEPTEKQMALLEAQYAKGKKLNEIRRTVFGVRNNAGKFEFYVVEQENRAG
jgi:hypothetical protein